MFRLHPHFLPVPVRGYPSRAPYLLLFKLVFSITWACPYLDGPCVLGCVLPPLASCGHVNMIICLWCQVSPFNSQKMITGTNKLLPEIHWLLHCLRHLMVVKWIGVNNQALHARAMASGFWHVLLWPLRQLSRAVRAARVIRAPCCFFKQGTSLWELILQLWKHADCSREQFFVFA